MGLIPPKKIILDLFKNGALRSHAAAVLVTESTCVSQLFVSARIKFLATGAIKLRKERSDIFIT